MAWIESHQELGQHPKTIRFAELLNLSMPSAIGHLHYFWWWALDFAPTGQIRTTATVVARASQWRGKPDRYLQALIDAGFVDVHHDELWVHDWLDYAGRLIERRAANRARQRRHRNGENGVTSRVTNALVTGLPYPTGPYPTGPDHTGPDPIPLPPSEPSEGGEAPPEAPDLSTNGHTGGVRPKAGRVRPKAEQVDAPACCANFVRTGEHWAKCPVALAEAVTA